MDISPCSSLSSHFTASCAACCSTLDILLIGGVPLSEPATRYGPFVMNTKEEILQAIEGYQNVQMGKIAIQ
ncbi:MAG: pirin-like C-terminal cupin domain-containing protein [Nitrososphaeraceae archaeon]